MTELPWDDAERLPALLRQIEQAVAEQLVALRREYHIWRAHQPALRREIPPARFDAPGSWPAARLARHLVRLGEDAREALEDLDEGGTLDRDHRY